MPKFEYKITWKTQLSHLKFTWQGVIVSVIFILFMIYVRGIGISEINVLLVISLGVLFLYEVPALILYLRYYSLDEGKVMTYEPNEFKITICDAKGNKESVFTLDDIKYIFHSMTGAMESKGLHLTSWSEYNYSKIYLNNGEMHLITSLMVYRLELPIGERYEVITSFYPYPK